MVVSFMLERPEQHFCRYITGSQPLASNWQLALKETFPCNYSPSIEKYPLGTNWPLGDYTFHNICVKIIERMGMERTRGHLVNWATPWAASIASQRTIKCLGIILLNQMTLCSSTLKPMWSNTLLIMHSKLKTHH
jgi:hypothetical protein